MIDHGFRAGKPCLVILLLVARLGVVVVVVVAAISRVSTRNLGNLFNISRGKNKFRRERATTTGNPTMLRLRIGIEKQHKRSMTVTVKVVGEREDA